MKTRKNKTRLMKTPSSQICRWNLKIINFRGKNKRSRILTYRRASHELNLDTVERAHSTAASRYRGNPPRCQLPSSCILGAKQTNVVVFCFVCFFFRDVRAETSSSALNLGHVSCFRGEVLKGMIRLFWGTLSRKVRPELD